MNPVRNHDVLQAGVVTPCCGADRGVSMATTTVSRRTVPKRVQRGALVPRASRMEAFTLSMPAGPDDPVGSFYFLVKPNLGAVSQQDILTSRYLVPPRWWSSTRDDEIRID